MDPDGECFGLFLLGAAIIGGVFKGIQSDGSWDWVKAIQGAGASMYIAGTMYLSVAMPGIVPTGLGGLPGFMTAGGMFVTTTVNTGAMNWMAYGSFEPNFVAAGISAVPGIIQGIAGGVEAVRFGGRFWDGTGATFDDLAIPVSSNNIEISGELKYSNEFAKEFSDENFSNKIQPNELYANGSTPKGYTRKGDIVFNRDGNQVRGVTEFLGIGNGSDVYLFKAAFTSKEQLYFTMGHEYLHVGFNYAGFGHTKAMRQAKHASIYKWEALQSQAWGFNEFAYAKRYMAYRQYYNSTYDYRRFGFSILSTKPW